MGGMKISELDFLRLLPVFMRDDEAVIALSKAVNQLIGEPSKQLNTLSTWGKTDDLNEAECDELAWELDIDWYDSTGMSLEEKQETIKAAQQIKRKRGTKWAVEHLITAYFGEGYVMEWYETDDSPFTFVVLTTNADITAENYEKFKEAANAAKNERSHLAKIFFLWLQGPDPGVECAMGSNFHRYEYKKCGTEPRTATVGLLMKDSIETEPEEALHLYTQKKAGEETCGTYPQPGTVGAIMKTRAVTEAETTHALYTFPKCGVNVCEVRQGTAVVGSAIVGSAILTA